MEGEGGWVRSPRARFNGSAVGGGSGFGDCEVASRGVLEVLAQAADVAWVYSNNDVGHERLFCKPVVIADAGSSTLFHAVDAAFPALTCSSLQAIDSRILLARM